LKITIEGMEEQTDRAGNPVLFIEGTDPEGNHRKAWLPSALREGKADILFLGSTAEIKFDKQTRKPTGVFQSGVKEAVSQDKSSDYAAFYLKRNSIEMQNARTNVTNLWIAWSNLHKDEMSLDDVITHIIYDTVRLAQGIVPPAQTEATPAPLQSENVETAIKVPESFATVGAMYQWCLNKFQMNKTKVDAALKEHSLVINPLLIKSGTDIALVADILAVRG